MSKPPKSTKTPKPKSKKPPERRWLLSPAALKKAKIALQPSGPHARWMTLVDELPIRAAMLREHEALEDQTATVRERLERFETADLPAYTRWEARALGPLLTAIREAEGEINRQRSILEAVEDEMFFSGCSELAAYRRVMQALEAGPDDEVAEEAFGGGTDAGVGGDASGFGTGDFMFGESDLPPGFDADQFDLLSAARKKEFRTQYAFMAELYEAATGRPAPDLDELLKLSRQKNRRGAEPEEPKASRGPSTPPPRPGRAAPEPPRDLGKERVSVRLKELYRILVRKLHPDLNPKQTPREGELWHRVQDAYHKKDLETLEAAVAQVELAVPGAAGKLPIHLLRRVIADLRQSLRALKSQLATARKHAAWDFTAKTSELPKYEAKQRQKLEHRKQSVEHYLQAITTQLDALAKRAAKPQRARKPRRQPEYFQEDLW